MRPRTAPIDEVDCEIVVAREQVGFRRPPQDADVQAPLRGGASPGGARAPSRPAQGEAAEGPPRSRSPPPEFRTLMDGGATAYADLDVRGDSSSLPSDHPVIAALHERLRSGRPARATTGCCSRSRAAGCARFGAAGMVAALHHLNLTDAFDGVYGSSAGTLIGAYFLSRQLPLYGCSIYPDQFPSAGREFLDLRNIARTLGFAAPPVGHRDQRPAARRLGMPVLNLDYVHDEVVQKRMPIDWARLWEAQEHQPLRVVASNLASERAVVLGARSHWASLPGPRMRASMLLPGPAAPSCRPARRARRPGPDAAKAAAEKAAGGGVEGDEEHAAAAWRDAMAAAKPSAPGPPARRPSRTPTRCSTSRSRTARRSPGAPTSSLRTRPDGVNVVKKQSAFEKLVGHRFFDGRCGAHVADHMMEQKHRQIYAEDILTLNEGLGAAARRGRAAAAADRAAARRARPRGLQPADGVRAAYRRPLRLRARVRRARAAGAPDGWDVAAEIFDDEILKEIEKKQKAPIWSMRRARERTVFCGLMGARVWWCVSRRYNSRCGFQRMRDGRVDATRLRENRVACTRARSRAQTKRSRVATSDAANSPRRSAAGARGTEGGGRCRAARRRPRSRHRAGDEVPEGDRRWCRRARVPNHARAPRRSGDGGGRPRVRAQRHRGVAREAR